MISKKYLRRRDYIRDLLVRCCCCVDFLALGSKTNLNMFKTAGTVELRRRVFNSLVESWLLLLFSSHRL